MNSTSDKLSPYFSLQLESLRGISAIVVLFTHSFQAFIAPFDLSLYSWVRLLGQAAVMIFLCSVAFNRDFDSEQHPKT